MKAAVIRQHGGPEVLELAELPDPVPGHGEALVRVGACALNHLDLWTRRGLPGRSVPFPHVLGNDVAGEIAAPPAGAAVPVCRARTAPAAAIASWAPRSTAAMPSTCVARSPT
jgi:NADPH:quinone reductase-like Zn-dependent oxidoreductase